MFDKILIANRGEIACRIIKTAKRLKIKTVAIYSDIDRTMPHVLAADEAYCVGPAESRSSYLNGEKIIQLARKAGCQAIHPGYGFLSENSDFAKACEQAGITFIGPPSSAIEAMGSKSSAKNILAKSGVATIPGYHGSDQSPTTLLAHARKIGFPLLLKASAGGGGKGMRIVEQESDFLESLNGAKREAMSSFKDDTLLIEKLLIEARHIEVQIFADSHENCVHLFERDCSLQRRHQKIIEEAPAPGLSPELRQSMGQAAVTVAKTIDYIGAGTIEFLVDKQGAFYFMEMNTRLQVEHPITEMITGVDLVEWQLRIAAGESLPVQQEDIHHRGCAIEARIYAEDPNNAFLPASGKITHLRLPEPSPHVRIDSGITQGSEVSIHYDPMLAKLIVWGEDRAQAIKTMIQALDEYRLLGIKNNCHFLKTIVADDAFKKGETHTGFIGQQLSRLLQTQAPNSDISCLLTALYSLLKSKQHTVTSPWELASGWQMNLPPTQCLQFERDQTPITLKVTHQLNAYQCKLSDTIHSIEGQLAGESLTAYIDGQYINASIIKSGTELHLYYHGQHDMLTEISQRLAGEDSLQTQGQLTAPMPGTVVAVLAKNGQIVTAGEGLVIIEAMKMEHTICAPKTGTVENIYYRVGDQVNEGDELVELHHEDE